MLGLIPVDGIPRRHPDANKWYHRINTTSRDQLIPYLCFVATPNKVRHNAVRKAFFSLWRAHAWRLWALTWNTKRNFRYPTPEEHALKSTPDVPYDYSSKMPDICGPNIWAIYIRGLLNYCKPVRALLPALYPLLCVLDLHKFADVCILYFWLVVGHRIGPTSNPQNIDHDMQNSTLCLHYSAHNYATPISWLSWKMYRPFGQRGADSFFQQPEEPRLDLAINMLD